MRRLNWKFAVVSAIIHMGVFMVAFYLVSPDSVLDICGDLFCFNMGYLILIVLAISLPISFLITVIVRGLLPITSWKKAIALGALGGLGIPVKIFPLTPLIYVPITPLIYVPIIVAIIAASDWLRRDSPKQKRAEGHEEEASRWVAMRTQKFWALVVLVWVVLFMVVLQMPTIPDCWPALC